MGQINQRDFSSGYTPDDDYLDGRPNGQLRMDNLTLEDNGAIALSRTSTQINKVLSGQKIVSCYSKYLNGKLYRFYQLGDYTVWCDADQSGNFSTLIADGHGGPKAAAYGSGFGNIFVSNGSENKRFDGTTVNFWGGLRNIGSPKVIGLQDAVQIHWYGPDGGRFQSTSSLQAGSQLQTDYGWCQFSTAPSNSGILRITPLAAQNMNIFTNSSDVGKPTDQFVMAFMSPAYYPNVTKVEVRAYTSASDYFWFSFGPVWLATNWNNWSLPTFHRQDFQITGNPVWTNIIYTEVRVTSATPVTVAVAQPWEFYNSNIALANLNTGLDGSSPYEYYQQNLTQYMGASGKSPLGMPSRPLFGRWAAALIQPNPSNDTRVYETDIYKTGGQLSDNYYFVGAIVSPQPAAPNNAVWDHQTDLETQSEDITNDSANFLADIPTGIRMIEGPLNGRMVMMTDSSVYFTDYQNPDAIDDRMTIQPSNSADEALLFISRSSNTVLILASTQDFYEISGTWTELDNGVFDIYNRAAGIKQPAISPAYCMKDNWIIYVSASGLRQLGFSITQVVSKELSSFFKGLARYGVAGFYVNSYETDTDGLRWALAYCKQNIYFRISHTDGTRSVFIYDLSKDRWYRRTDSDVICFFTEESGTLLVGREQGYLGTYDSQWTQDIINYATTQTFYYQSSCLTGETPFQRKDLFTLKLWLAGWNVQVYLQDENFNQVNLGVVTSAQANIVQQFFIPVHGCNIDLSQRFCLILTSSTSPYFKLDHWVLDYDERPPRELFMFIPNNNFGSPSKKRIRTLPMVIDTFGQPVTYTPVVDLQTQSQTSTFTTNGKQTVYHLFQTDVFGVDYGGNLQANTAQPFEFYNLMNPVSVEELPPPKLFDQIGPYALDKRGKIYGFRVRMVSFTTSINYTIFGDDVAINSGSFATNPGVDTTYEILRLPPGLICNIVRIEFTSPDNTKPFMRWYVQIRFTISGMETDEKWVTIAGKVAPTE